MQRTLSQVLAITAAMTLAAILVGCDTSPPSKDLLESVNYGPKPDNYQQIIQDYLRNRLTDPTAAIIDFKAGPTQMYQKDAVVRDLQFGWAVCAMVNDKNTRGAYTGFYPAVYFIRNGKIVASNGGPGDGAVGTQFATRQCKELGYQVP